MLEGRQSPSDRPSMHAVECVPEWFRRRANEAPDRSALTFLDETWTRREIFDQAEALAAHFRQTGVVPGDRIAFFGFTHPLLLVALFAALRIGAIFVPLNFRLSAKELADVIRSAGIHTLLYDEAHAKVIADDRVSSECIICEPTQEIIEVISVAAVACRLNDLDISGEPTDPLATALLLYTSGTTGAPKGVMLSHENIWAACVTAVLENDFCEHDVGLSCAPLFHAAGLNALTLPIIMAGGHLVLQPHFDPEDFIASVHERRVTISVLVPAMMMRVMESERFRTTDLTSIRLLISGGAPVPLPILQEYSRRGIPISQAYGMTETTSAIIRLRAVDAIGKMGSCGRTTPLGDVRLVNASGDEITLPNSPGEIWVRSPLVAAGYWRQTGESTEIVDAEGWLHTGDIAYVDNEGFYYICDRIKDMIISGGENVYAAEVEAALASHPSISDVAVIGLPHEHWGECVTAIVALKAEKSLSLMDLSEHLDGNLARYKIPKGLFVLNEIPRNAFSKIDKVKLRTLFG